ncbi:MAG: hypothetical protein JO089_06835 [Alphaproteobacteria bacterium]|nr:hypothetical protein [Alphaproteobacteria bacterium]
MSAVFNLLGTLGVVCFLSAFLLLQKGTLKADGYDYLALNLAGSILLMLSLSWDWNLSAFGLEAAWGLISLYGLLKRWRRGGAS